MGGGRARLWCGACLARPRPRRSSARFGGAAGFHGWGAERRPRTGGVGAEPPLPISASRAHDGVDGSIRDVRANGAAFARQGSLHPPQLRSAIERSPRHEIASPIERSDALDDLADGTVHGVRRYAVFEHFPHCRGDISVVAPPDPADFDARSPTAECVGPRIAHFAARSRRYLPPVGARGVARRLGRGDREPPTVHQCVDVRMPSATAVAHFYLRDSADHAPLPPSMTSQPGESSPDFPRSGGVRVILRRERDEERPLNLRHDWRVPLDGPPREHWLAGWAPF